jgi:hypothetical protein
MLVAGYLATLLAPARAQTLAVPGSVSGTLSATNTKNTYSVTAPVDGDVTFTVTTDANLYGLMRFYDSDGATQINYAYCSYGSSATLTIPHLGPGATYYVSVEIDAGSGNYTLSDTQSQPPYAINTEPNDTPTQGIPLTVGQTATGHVGYSRASYYKSDNIDYYKYTVPVDGDVTFTLTTDSTLYGLMRFWDSNGTSQINYAYCSYGASATLTIPHLAPGATYYVSVEVDAGYGSYQIQSSEVQPPYAKNTEPNNTYKQSIKMGIEKPVTGHVGYSTTSYYTTDNIDYYNVRPTADGDITFTLTTDSTLYGLLRFWDSNGKSQINYVYCSYGSSASLTIPHVSAYATYYVSVEVDAGYGSYKVTNALVKPKEKPGKEPNDTYKQALPFTLEKSVQGLIGYSTTSYYKTDHIDFYKVTVTTGGTLTVNVATEPTLYGLVRLWSTDGTAQLTYAYCSYGSAASLSYALPAAGTYYVSIEVDAGYGGYTLSNSF